MKLSHKNRSSADWLKLILYAKFQREKNLAYCTYLQLLWLCIS